MKLLLLFFLVLCASGGFTNALRIQDLNEVTATLPKCPQLSTFFEVTPNGNACSGMPTTHTPEELRPYADYIDFKFQATYNDHDELMQVVYDCDGRLRSDLPSFKCTVFRILTQSGYRYFLRCPVPFKDSIIILLSQYDVVQRIFREPTCTIVSSQFDLPHWSSSKSYGYFVNLHRKGVRLSDLIEHPFLLDDGCSGCLWTLEEGTRGHELYLQTIHLLDEKLIRELDFAALATLKETVTQKLEHTMKFCETCVPQYTVTFPDIPYQLLGSMYEDRYTCNEETKCKTYTLEMQVTEEKLNDLYTTGFAKRNLNVSRLPTPPRESKTHDHILHGVLFPQWMKPVPEPFRVTFLLALYIFYAYVWINALQGVWVLFQMCLDAIHSPSTFFQRIQSFKNFIRDQLIEWLDDSPNADEESEPESNPSTKSKETPEPEKEK